MILQRYILRELLTQFLFAFAAVMGVSLLGTTFQVFRSFEGLGIVLILKIAPLAAGYMAPWALLVASATAATLVYGRMSAENEVTAMKACGIGSLRILAPAFLFALLLAGVGHAFAEYITPMARHHRRVSLRMSVFEVLKFPPPGVQRFTIGSTKLSYVDFKDGRLEMPSLLRFEREDLVMEYHAPSGRILIDDLSARIIMSKPRYTQYDPKTGSQHRFEAQSDVEIPLPIQDVIDPVRRDEDLPSDVLRDKYRASTDRRKRASYMLILQTRWAQAAAPFLLVLACAPIGIWVRKGSRLAGLGAALPPLLFYFTAFFITQGMGEKGRMAPLAAAWLPDAGLALVALVLLWRSRR